MFNRIKILLINSTLLVLLVWPLQQAIAATATEQIEGLIKQGQLDEALTLTNKSLTDDRDNVSYLFLKGLILTRQNNLDDAKKIFIRLTQEHPELPEPFNNLAVIYAEQGDFNNAREALQMAINTHPSYATAQENLGDIYAKMASKAYNQALELDQDNASAREKLLLVGDLFSIKNAEPATPPPVDNEESERIASELDRQAQTLKNAENQTQVELNRAQAARQELENHNKTIETLKPQQLQAEQEARDAIAQAQTAKAELTRVQQQAVQITQQSQLEQQQAEAQISKLRTEITAITNELNQLTANRDKTAQQSVTEQQQSEEQASAARSAAVQERTELAALEQRAREMRASMDRQAAAAEEQLNQSRQTLLQLQGEISQLEQKRTAMTGQAEQERVLAQAQVQDNKAELEKISTELARLQRERTALETQNRQATAQLEVAAAAPPTPATPAPTSKPNEQDLVAVAQQWAQHWSAKDVEGYLSVYADDFRPSDDSSRSAWAAQRREKIRKPRFIRVELTGIKVKFLNDQYAQVSFKQSYQSESYKDSVDKTLLLRSQNGRWVISEETTR